MKLGTIPCCSFETFCLDISFVLRMVSFSCFFLGISFSSYFCALLRNSVLWATKLAKKLSCATKLAQKTSQCYFAQQRFYKTLPNTTSYYRTCASTSHYYSVLQSLHELLPSTTWHFEGCTKYFPALLRAGESFKDTILYML